jgi:hypothetical protein
MPSTITANNLAVGNVIDSGAGGVTRTVKFVRPPVFWEPANTTIATVSDLKYPDNWYNLIFPNAQNVVIN